MRKFQIIALALFAVFALSSTVVATASAETTKTAEWLVKETAITSALAIEATGELTLEDSKTIAGAASVLCSGTLDGTVGPGAADLIELVLNLAKEEIGGLTGLGLQCIAVQGCEAASAESPIEVYVANLPWHTTLFEMANGEILDLIVGATYQLLCLVLKLHVEDECGGATEDTEFPVLNDPENAAIPIGVKSSPGLHCTMGGAGSGFQFADELIFINLVSGELLSVS